MYVLIWIEKYAYLYKTDRYIDIDLSLSINIHIYIYTHTCIDLTPKGLNVVQLINHFG
jgi:hypothetical protein